jgi:hypothetical protein
MCHDTARPGRRRISRANAGRLITGLVLLLKNSKGKLGCLAVVTLMLWSEGFGRLPCCASEAEDLACHNSSRRAASVAALSSEASCAEHSCCKQLDEARGMIFRAGARIPAGMKTCCQLKGGRFGPAALPQSVCIVQPSIGGGQTLSLSVGLNVLPLLLRTSVPDRGSTYLRCCVLLI